MCVFSLGVTFHGETRVELNKNQDQIHSSALWKVVVCFSRSMTDLGQGRGVCGSVYMSRQLFVLQPVSLLFAEERDVVGRDSTDLTHHGTLRR